MEKNELSLQQVTSIIHAGESDTVEFKKSSAELMSAMQTLCAFLNHKGGKVLIGVTDGGRLIGQHVSDQSRQEIANLLRKIEPAPTIEIDYVPITDSSLQLIVLTAIHDAYTVPYTFSGKAFYRLQSTTSLMPQEQYQRLLLEKTQKSKGWEDGIVTDITIDDFDHTELLKTIQEGISSGRIPPTKSTSDPLEALTRLQLVKGNHFINASIVLFAKEPTRWLPQCRLRLARFRGTDKRNIMDSKQIEGNAFQLLDEALIFVQRHLPIASHFEPGKIERIDQPLIPIDALRELFVNAICHRDYRSTGGSISCAIYDNHLEIWNEGLLPEGFSFSDLKSLHESRPGNPRIARVLYCRKLFESWGSGIELVDQLCQQAGNLEPKFFERNGGFCVHIPLSSVETIPAKHASSAVETINARQKEILALLKENVLLSVSDLESMLSGSAALRTIKKDLSQLSKENLIESHGKGRGTRWKRKS